MSGRLAGPRVRRVLFGNDARGVRNVAVALVGSSLGFTLLINIAFTSRSVVTPLARFLWWEPGGLLLVGIAAATAYRFGGLAHCWVIGFAPTFGGAANLLIMGMGMGGSNGPLEILGVGLLGGVTGAVVLGTPGYVVGWIVGRVQR